MNLLRAVADFFLPQRAPSTVLASDADFDRRYGFKPEARIPAHWHVLPLWPGGLDGSELVYADKETQHRVTVGELRCLLARPRRDEHGRFIRDCNAPRDSHGRFV